MVRKLPTDPAKRRRQIFKRIFQNLEHFHSLLESGDMMQPGMVTLETGEEVYLNDLMTGINTLPPRQRQAFELICLKGYTETAARDEMLPNSKSSTPVQQYADSALDRMIDAYDQVQAGTWEPPVTKAPKPTWRSTVMTVLHPLLRRHLETARQDILTQIEGLKVGLQQVDDLLKQGPAFNSSPRPELNQVAKDLAAVPS